MIQSGFLLKSRPHHHHHHADNCNKCGILKDKVKMQVTTKRKQTRALFLSDKAVLPFKNSRCWSATIQLRQKDSEH